MKFREGCWRRRLAVLVTAKSLVTGCATAGFESGHVAACPPVLEYNRKFQARATEELALFPGGSAVAELMRDYAVMREQARAFQ
ncbi:MAG: hypothetical protein AAFR73_03265 [Pseudomonadota bacterium]